MAFKTFGCRANSLDTDYLTLKAKEQGYTIVSDKDPADVYVLNSCTVTDDADKEARQAARRFKRQNQDSLVAVLGCYGQVAQEEITQIQEVDYVLGTAHKDKIFELASQSLPLQKNQADQVPTGFLPSEYLGSRRSRASVKIQDGCNFKCTFCIIPQARGRSRSLSLQEACDQIKSAYEMGYQEVVLTGVHLAHYGWDQKTDLMALLNKVLKWKEGPRVRLSTLDPFEIPDEMIQMLGTEKRLCPYFHIALQSGSDSILKQMKRIYPVSDWIEVTQKIQAQDPDTFIGVDVIAGFPGETDQDHQQTMKILEETFWAKLHVFPYSIRTQTVAGDRADQIPADIKQKRVQELLSLSQKRYDDFLRSQLGKSKNIVIEKKRDHHNYYRGYTENYIPVRLPLTLSYEVKSLVKITLTEESLDRDH